MRFMHQCSGKYQAAAKAGCGVNAAKARPPRPRGITLGIGDVVSITIFEPPGGLFVPSDAGATRQLRDAAKPNPLGVCDMVLEVKDGQLVAPTSQEGAMR
jgi:hypothetical protein